MTSGLLQNLARTTRIMADHPDPSARFGMMVGFFCDLTLQNDMDGIWISFDASIDQYRHLDDAEDMRRGMRVPRIRNDLGEIVDLPLDGTEWVGNTAIELAREISLVDDREIRIVAIEATAIRLIQDIDDELEDLLETVARVRNERLSVEALGVPVREPVDVDASTDT
jgi:hypothetical protein